jgi:hypothetical protein
MIIGDTAVKNGKFIIATLQTYLLFDTEIKDLVSLQFFFVDYPFIFSGFQTP